MPAGEGSAYNSTVACVSCGGAVPVDARFCPSCGVRSSGVGASESATRLSPLDAPAAGPRRTPALAATGAPGSGWLTASDSISHGRFPPGTVFDARYRIIGLLGRGGMGEVYRADDLRLGQPVALKLLPENLQHDPVRLAQFHNEVRTARQVSHPNVCRVYDIGEADGLLYLSMEYVDGEDLATSLRRVGRFPEDRAIDLAHQLCGGLAAAHQRGVMHRDLKPANVMLDGAGRVRIMDFGLAAIGPVEDIRAGTPAYMAPEQLLGREVTARSDIFALGLVLYELFTGRRAFDAPTIGELVAQHEARAVTPPSRMVSALDPAVERAILRCLEIDPERRPASALAVTGLLPGGDPLAAALAAGETPSPEMVAAAGEGVGFSPRAAWVVFVAVLAGVAASFVMALSTSPLEYMRPELTGDVLAQKAREAVRQLGGPGRGGDEAYGFRWDRELMEHVQASDKPAPRWRDVLTQRPSALEFWYRSSTDPLTGLSFHTDLLTPGLVVADDPAPIVSGMTEVDLDASGRLVFYERIAPQRQDAPTAAVPVDWQPLFSLAALDPSQLKPAEPLWNWLAGADTRAAWTGTWPESGRPLRVEAAAFGGHPVAFMVVGPWRKPWRMPSSSTGGDTVTMIVLLALAMTILGTATLLARRNLRDGRGDRAGASRLAAAMWGVLMLLWLCQVHFAVSAGLLAMFLLAICTATFYGVLLWTLYIAFEPFVRRHWPQVLVSWTSVLTGRARDRVVGRDVLVGIALGVAWVVIVRAVDRWTDHAGIVSFPGDTELLMGLRSAAGLILQEAPYSIRNALLYFFLLFLLRVALRGERVAALAFAGGFALLSALGSDHPWRSGFLSLLYFGSGAVVLLRWGLVAFVVAAFVNALLLDVPASRDVSAWYFGTMLLPVLIVAGIASWALYTAVIRRAPQLTSAGR
jgi:serine/threonine-protein kinase